jgi:PPOX class probable F420-dependent enzyme
MVQLAGEDRRRVDEARVARLATVRPDGRPHVVAVTFAFDGTTIVTAIDHKPKTTTSLQRSRNIQANPVASVLVDNYDDDWSQLWWLRGDGSARLAADGPRRQQAIDRLAAKYAQYRHDPPDGPVIVVTVERWSSWSAKRSQGSSPDIL